MLATQDKVARACEAGHIGPADVRALWADEGDYGNNPDERRGSFSWDIIQRTLWTSWVNLFSGTCAEWMRDLPELARGAPSSPPHLSPPPSPPPPPPPQVRFTYGDLYRSFDACQLTVTTLCAHGLVVGGRRIGDEPLTEEDVGVIRTDRRARQQHLQARPAAAEAGGRQARGQG